MERILSLCVIFHIAEQKKCDCGYEIEKKVVLLHSIKNNIIN